MARVLETLQLADQGHAHDAGPVVRPFCPEDSDLDADAPFIEVGGPAGAVVGQKSAIATPPRRKTGDDAGPVLCPVGDGPVQVSFRPLPFLHAPLKPACERFAPSLVAFHEPESPVSEQYRALLAGIESQLEPGKPHVLLFTSAVAGAGATTVLLNLAVTCARKNCRAAVVDAQLRHPAVAARLGLNPVPGTREVLAGRLAPARAVRDAGMEGLSVVTAGAIRDGDETLLEKDALRSLMQHLRDHQDYVFVDAAPWSEDGVSALAAVADAVYLVLPESAADQTDIRNIVQAVAGHGGQLRGCILAQR